MPIVVVDTNALRNSPGLSSKAWVSLIRNARAWGVKVVVPTVVLMETINLLQREMANAIAGAEKLSKDLRRFGLPGLEDSTNVQLRDLAESFELGFRRTLNDAGVEVVSVPSALRHEEVALRAIKKRAPYSDGKEKDCYRDTLIWLTLLEVAGRYLVDDIWLVSTNVNDFGAPGQGAGGGLVAFRKELVDELRELGIADRVKLATKLEALEAHLAAERTPLGLGDLNDRLELIDQAKVILALRAALRGVAVDVVTPRPVDLTVVVGFEEEDVPPIWRWIFTDPAERSDGSWTARYIVEIPIEFGGAFRAGFGAKDSFMWFTESVTIQGVLRANGAEGFELVATTIQASADRPSDVGSYGYSVVFDADVSDVGPSVEDTPMPWAIHSRTMRLVDRIEKARNSAGGDR
ncbi:PIN domain-containing protein [Nocardia tengchongensis]|uniref:PIN domain-containing protein n=1 Tax=Nocardia tengchongensis TaxID=2055889 RepID=UPI00364750F0